MTRLGLTVAEQRDVPRIRRNRTSKRRRDERRGMGKCINEPNAGGHGHVVKGGRCEACWRVKKLGADTAHGQVQP